MQAPRRKQRETRNCLIGPPRVRIPPRPSESVSTPRSPIFSGAISNPLPRLGRYASVPRERDDARSPDPHIALRAIVPGTPKTQRLATGIRAQKLS